MSLACVSLHQNYIRIMLVHYISTITNANILKVASIIILKHDILKVLYHNCQKIKKIKNKGTTKPFQSYILLFPDSCIPYFKPSGLSFKIIYLNLYHYIS